MTDTRDVLVSREGAIATITLNRPDAYNAYLTGTLEELAKAFNAASDDDAVGVIVYTGAGTRAFCTGGDVKEYRERYTRSPHEYWKYMSRFRAYIESILRCGKPVIARLNGMAVGGGNESNLACDLTIMAEHAWVGQVGVRVGSVACGGATQWLPLVVGDKRAREMLMLNQRIGARKALEWGLANAVAPSVRCGDAWIENATPEQIDKAQRGKDGHRIDLSKLDAAVRAAAEGLLDKFPECLRYTKTQVNFLKNFVWDSTVPHAQDWLSLHFAAAEPMEGMSAFVEKRDPDVRGTRAALAAGKAPELEWGPGLRGCAKCGAKRMPEAFAFCGACGAKL